MTSPSAPSELPRRRHHDARGSRRGSRIALDLYHSAFNIEIANYLPPPTKPTTRVNEGKTAPAECFAWHPVPGLLRPRPTTPPETSATIPFEQVPRAESWLPDRPVASRERSPHLHDASKKPVSWRLLVRVISERPSWLVLEPCLDRCRHESVVPHEEVEAGRRNMATKHISIRVPNGRDATVILVARHGTERGALRAWTTSTWLTSMEKHDHYAG